MFSPHFIWGTATSAPQIEGGADKDGRSPSIWDTFSAKPGAIEGGGSPAHAADHYNHWEEDLDLLTTYGIKNYRFSLSWPRLMQDGVTPNQAGIAFYNRLIDGMIERGITPWVTIYHWDLPQALQDKGGWVSRDILGWFSAYADLCFHSFGDRVKNWIILNEPSVTSLLGHGYGFHAPGLKDAHAYAASAHHQNLVIGQIYRAAKKLNPDWNIGSSYTCLRCPPESEETPQSIVDSQHAFWNGNFFDPLFKGHYPNPHADLFKNVIQTGDMEICRVTLDFIGLQHYSSIRAGWRPEWIAETFFGKRPAEKPATGIGWPIEPDEFHGALMDLKKSYGTEIPIIITENGSAWHDTLSPDGQCHDPKRISYLENYLEALHQAVSDGVDVRGYFVWSFLDNFEWSDGYAPRFGLVYVDYENDCKRTAKDSLKWFSQSIKSGFIDKSE